MDMWMCIYIYIHMHTITTSNNRSHNKNQNDGLPVMTHVISGWLQGWAEPLNPMHVPIHTCKRIVLGFTSLGGCS